MSLLYNVKLFLAGQSHQIFLGPSRLVSVFLLPLDRDTLVIFVTTSRSVHLPKLKNLRNFR